MKKILTIWALLMSVCYAQSKAGFYVVGGKIITVQDTSSRKYLKAIENAGVVPSVLQNFTSNYLVTSEKEIGVYSIIDVQWPFIGGTAATHSINQINPSGSFNLSFNAGFVHSSGGIKGNGSSSFANTFYNPSTQITNLNQFSAMLYTDGSTDTGIDLGLIFGSTNRIALTSKFLSGGNASSQLYDVSSTLALSNLFTSKGAFIANRQSITSNKLWRNGLVINSNTTSNPLANLSTLNGNVSISALVSTTGTAFNFTARRQQYVAFFDGVLTDSQSEKQSHIVTFTQSLLGR